MHFSLIAYLVLGGQIHAFKLDSHLTYDDCLAAVSAGVRSAEIVPGMSVDLRAAPLVCQIETSPDIVVAAYGED